MKRLGNRDVWVITHTPGRPPYKLWSFRMVYQDHAGNHYIRWKGGKARIEPSSTPDTFELHDTIRSIQILTGDDFMGVRV